MQTYGLVLAGGGAKGAYQVGAWKAMRELNIQIEAIAGVSIGAINGAMIAQGDYDEMIELWSEAKVTSGVNLSSELKDPSNLFSLSNLPQLAYEIIKNGGVDVTPAKQIIASHVDEKKVRESGIPVGFVTFQLSGMKPIEMFVEDMPEGELVDYLMASARVPGLNRQGPSNATYLDGGVYDNAPIEMLRKRGINQLIVVDISGMKGIGHKQELSCANIVYIRPYDIKELGESFEFDDSKIETRIEMGYLDTKKAFGCLAGQFYYFIPDEFRRLQKDYGIEAVNELEQLALEYELPRLTVYTEHEFLTALWEKIDEYDQSFEVDDKPKEEPAEENDKLGNEEQESVEETEKEGFFKKHLHRPGKMLLKKLSIYSKTKKYSNAIQVLEELFKDEEEAPTE